VRHSGGLNHQVVCGTPCAPEPNGHSSDHSRGHHDRLDAPVPTWMHAPASHVIQRRVVLTHECNIQYLKSMHVMLQGLGEL
jgi:hypothetical protein